MSPIAAAARIRCPVFIIHGERDRKTRPDHCRRVFQALPGADKRLLIAPGAGHGDALNAETWKQVDAWMDTVVR